MARSHLHDTYRYDKGGAGTFDKVVRAARLMQEHKVEFNVLCTVNSVNSVHPLEVYRFFRDELGARYLQLIPIVERENTTGHQEGTRITDRSVRPEQWGKFLIAIFDEWVRRDVGIMFVQFFDAVLASYVRGYSTVCVLQPTCGQGRRARTQRRSLLLRSLCRAKALARQYPRQPDRDPRFIGKATRVRPGQVEFAAAVLPQVRVPFYLSRRMPKKSRAHDAGRRAGAQLAMRRVEGFLRPYRTADADHGRTVKARALRG